MKKIIFIINLMVTLGLAKVIAQTPTVTENAVIEKIPREALTTLTGATHTTVQSSVQYFDGLGRPTQTLVYKGSPDATKDILSSTTLYDAWGRVYKNILPAPSSGATGAYQPTAQALATSFYDSDANPFTETVFETSPLNRPKQQFGAGQAWRSGTGHPTTMEYLTAGTEILHFEIRANGTVEKIGTYPANSLLCHRTISERNFKTNEYQDRLGRVVAKSQELTAGVFAITLYLYDDLNRLRVIIPPEAYQSVSSMANFTESSSVFLEGMFAYKYDALSRISQKHIPGGGWTRYIYNKNDKIVLENDDRDAAQSPNYYKFTKYDALNRPIMTGLTFNIGAGSQTTLQSDFDNFEGQTYETASTNSSTGLGGYTNVSFPNSYKPEESNLRTLTYYDDYTWLTDTATYGFKNAFAFHAKANATGMVTGKLIRNLTSNTWQQKVFYYDYQGRIIQEFHFTHRNHLIRKDYQYRFNGELLKTRIDKKSGNTLVSSKVISYEYDHLGRKTKYKYSLNGNERTIATYAYDDIGRMSKKLYSPSSSIGSVQTGLWTNATTWQGGSIPTTSDQVTINAGHTVTIPNGQTVSAGTLFDQGTLQNLGTLSLGTLSPATSTGTLQTLEYKYHIRGGLLGINLDGNNDLTNKLFSFKLAYEDDGTYYDGNIRNQYWKSSIDGIQRAYQYSYDGASRLLSADYASNQSGENYALSGLSYDANGNIKTLSRNGATNSNYTSFGNVDNLTYTYQTNSNKLLRVTDATTSNTDLGDFRNGTNSDDDYEYWQDGSLKKDKNKKIASIAYNYLKLPSLISFDDGKTITTEYDAEGVKLKKIVSGGETTEYEQDDIYVNGSLYQTSHDEGRIVNGVFEYSITDHNNDLRIAFKDSAGIAVPTQSIFYDPWGLSMKGMAITRNPANFNKFQYLNRETQFETGYIDLIHRQFDPQTGRFTSQDPVIEGQEHLSLYQYGWNNPILKPDPDGLVPCCGGAVDFVMGFTHAFNEDVSPIPTKLVNSEGGNTYSSGAKLGHRAAMLVGAIEIGLGGGAVGGAAVATVSTAGVAAPVAAEVAVGGSAAIAHGVSTIKNAERNLNSEGKYSGLKEPRKVGEGLTTTSAQRKRILEENKKNNGGVLRSDGDGRILSSPKQSKKGEKMDMNQAEVDHIKPRSKGGSNSNSNQRVISKEENLQKGNREN